MPRKNENLPNKIKFSIWDTRIDESQRKVLDSPELIEGFNRNSSKKIDKED